MIQKLRWKFVIVNMSLVTAVLLIVFLAVTLSSARQANAAADMVLSSTMNLRMEEMMLPPEIGKGKGDRKRQQESMMPSILVQLNSNGDITDTKLRNASINDAALQEAVQGALSGQDSKGYLRDYQLRYAVRYTSEGTTIAFVDVSGNNAALRRQIGASLIIGFFGLSAFFVISLFLANWTLRPVETAWMRQKQFVADASHELKTPLTVILANTDILLSHPEATVLQQRRWVENTHAEGMRMKGLVEDMLYLAKADIAAPPAMEELDLSDTVWSAALPFESVAFEKGVTVETQIQEGIRLHGNAPMLKQLVAILLDNAIKYAGENGKATVQLQAAGETVHLAVNNTGNPIETEALPHVFERFYRAEGSRDRKTGGYGLGLAIAQSIAAQHHASIGVTSSAQEGTTFTVEWRNR